MDVDEDKWISVAIDNVDKYLHRGGEGKGDEPQLIGGTELLNTIGMAMGLPIRDPTTWSEREMERALRGDLVFFEGKSLEAINAIAETIQRCCSGDETNYVTVIPVELYYEKKLYELPIFRVHRHTNSQKYYVDNAGRYYKSFDDWYDNSKLPPCKMLFPNRLRLEYRPNYNYSHCFVRDTPSARLGSKAARTVDTVSAVAGISSGVGLLFASGGLATPLVVVGVASALWGTGRASNQLIDKATHGESINPFTDSESRMLWLGVAANIASFGAMGATMRLTSLAARGREISSALKILTNVANGTNLTISTIAIINNTVYLAVNYDKLSPVDVLFHVASIAFWTKGVYSYKTANTIIAEAHNQAFDQISKELSPEQQNELKEIRNRVQNDGNLLRQFISASQKNISIQEYSQFLIDGLQYYDTLANMSPEQIEAFASLRNFIRDDLRLLSGLRKVSTATNLNKQDTLELVLRMWQSNTELNFSGTGSDIRLSGGNLVLGSAPPIRITQMPELSASLIRFFGEHLSKIDTSTTHQWSVPELLTLQSRGLFTLCSVTGIHKGGHSIVTLNSQLQVSVKTLLTYPSAACESMIKLVGNLKPEHCTTTSKLPAEVVKLCVSEYRLRFEIHRKESIEFVTKIVNGYNKLSDIAKSQLLPHEKDRLYTFKTAVKTHQADAYMGNMVKFVAEMQPKNVSELVAYCEFVMTYIDDAMANIENDLRTGAKQLPRNAKKSVWKRQQASEEAFRDPTAMKQKLNELFSIVENNDMVGVTALEKGLPNDKLIEAIRSNKIKFGGKVSAAYHIFKHATDPPSAYVDQANSTMRSSSSRYNITLGQEGDTRLISFTDDFGSCFVLEKDGRVLLCSFRAHGRK
ncbi:uncharacterized protein LOC119836250 [Zerene cesonia]|uniref:uncharacterized protein LOC119836250 n=1 Tax=Zerene cesonia TaxID=33412 RepID=UPI0018E4E410|nr:uncharacterized protein LOC119836250 [Zerene cesonia]XP_038217456.1 uncharacterized protein LOC119836250 [Zerene cesonia]